VRRWVVRFLGLVVAIGLGVAIWGAVSALRDSGRHSFNFDATIPDVQFVRATSGKLERVCVTPAGESKATCYRVPKDGEIQIGRRGPDSGLLQVSTARGDDTYSWTSNGPN
jgi:hypothetical protein